jgi:hypothetical protein
MNRIPEPVSGPLAYASGDDPNRWRQAAGALGVFALFIGIARGALSSLWAVQSFGPRIGLVRPRALDSRELWIGPLHVAALLCSILLVCGAAAFLTRRRGGSLIALAALLLAILSIVTGASRAVFELSNYQRGAPIPFYVLIWAAVRASEGLLEATFLVMLAWAFMKMGGWRKGEEAIATGVKKSAVANELDA